MPTDTSYSSEIKGLLRDLKHRVARQADITILKELNEDLLDLADVLEESLWAWRLSSKLSETDDEAEEISKIRKKTGKFLENVRKNILEAKEDTSKLDLTSLKNEIIKINEEISKLNEIASKTTQNFKEEYGRRLDGLKDFSILLNSDDIIQLSDIQDFIDNLYSSAPSLARISGKDYNTLNKKIEQWGSLKTGLERISEKLKPEALLAEFTVKKGTIDVLKRLLKGEEIIISDIPQKALIDLRDSKISDKIQVRYRGERQS